MVIINTNFVELEYPMLLPGFKLIGRLVLQAKIFKIIAINGRGGHLGHVTSPIYANFPGVHCQL